VPPGERRIDQIAQHDPGTALLIPGGRDHGAAGLRGQGVVRAGVPEHHVAQPFADVLHQGQHMAPQIIAGRLAGLRRHVADIDLQPAGGAHRLTNVRDEQVGQHAGVQAAGT